MIEPVYVDVQKIAGSVAVPSKHLDSERRKFSHMIIAHQMEELVGDPVGHIRFEEAEAPTYFPQDLAWWQQFAEFFGWRSYPDRVEWMTRIVGYAWGCHHPFTGAWIQVDPKGAKSLAFLPGRRTPGFGAEDRFG